jgi:hypothetical protein
MRIQQIYTVLLLVIDDGALFNFLYLAYTHCCITQKWRTVAVSFEYFFTHCQNGHAHSEYSPFQMRSNSFVSGTRRTAQMVQRAIFISRTRQVLPNKIHERGMNIFSQTGGWCRYRTLHEKRIVWGCIIRPKNQPRRNSHFSIA